MLYVSLILFIILITIGIYKQREIPYCISSIYYNIGIWFTLLLGSANLVLIPYIIDITPNKYQFTSFLCCTSLLFVAFSPQYKERLEGNIHFISAGISALFAIAWSICIQPSGLFCGLIGLIGSIFNRKNWLFWCEISFFIMIYLILIIN